MTQRSANEVYEILKSFVKMERELGASDYRIRLALRHMCGDAMKQDEEKIKA